MVNKSYKKTEFERYVELVESGYFEFEKEIASYTWLPWVVERLLKLDSTGSALPILRKRVMLLEENYPKVCTAIKSFYSDIVDPRDIAALPLMMEMDEEGQAFPVFLVIDKKNFDFSILPISPMHEDLRGMGEDLYEISKLPLEDSFRLSVDPVSLV